MNKIFIISMILPLTIVSFSNNNDCNDFRIGTFKLNSVDGSIHTITRTKNKQIEEVGRNGSISEYDIKWTDDCTYILFNRKIIKGIDEFPEFKIDTLYNKVIGMDGNSFRVLTTIKEYDFESESTLEKIE